MNLRLPHFCSFTLLTVAVVIASGSAAQGATPTHAKFGAAWQTVDCKTFGVLAAIAANVMSNTSKSTGSSQLKRRGANSVVTTTRFDLTQLE